jgi:hypothetical protein
MVRGSSSRGHCGGVPINLLCCFFGMAVLMIPESAQAWTSFGTGADGMLNVTGGAAHVVFASPAFSLARGERLARGSTFIAVDTVNTGRLLPGDGNITLPGEPYAGFLRAGDEVLIYQDVTADGLDVELDALGHPRSGHVPPFRESLALERSGSRLNIGNDGGGYDADGLEDTRQHLAPEDAPSSPMDSLLASTHPLPWIRRNDSRFHHLARRNRGAPFLGRYPPVHTFDSRADPGGVQGRFFFFFFRFFLFFFSLFFFFFCLHGEFFFSFFLSFFSFFLSFYFSSHTSHPYTPRPLFARHARVRRG